MSDEDAIDQLGRKQAVFDDSGSRREPRCQFQRISHLPDEVGDHAAVGTRGDVAKLDRRQSPQCRAQTEKEQFQRYGRVEGLDGFGRIRDHDEAIRGCGDEFFARVGATTTLYEPAFAGDLVGPVHRDVEAIDLSEGLDNDAEGPRNLFGTGRCRDASKREIAASKRREEVRDGGPGTESDGHAVHDQLRGGLGGEPLFDLYLCCHRAPSPAATALGTVVCPIGRRAQANQPNAKYAATYFQKRSSHLIQTLLSGSNRCMLRGEKVGLRARVESDVAILHEELYDDVMTRSQADTRAWRPVAVTSEASPFRVSEPSDDCASFSVVELDHEALAGAALLWGIDSHNRSAHIGISLRPAFRGRALGLDTVRVLCAYGFSVLGMHRLSIETLSGNEAMIGVAEGAGFRREAVLREAAWVDGGFRDEVVLGLLASEWKSSRSSRAGLVGNGTGSSSDEIVDEAGRESFPASDPPAF